MVFTTKEEKGHYINDLKATIDKLSKKMFTLMEENETLGKCLQLLPLLHRYSGTLSRMKR
ncbi:MAG: hypothetical protein ACYDAO_06730 [Thermoplasmataceae archaeon]